MKLGILRSLLNEYDRSWQKFLLASVIGEYEEANQIREHLTAFCDQSNDDVLSEDELYVLAEIVAPESNLYFIPPIRAAIKNDPYFWDIIRKLHHAELLSKNIFKMIKQKPLDVIHEIADLLFQLELNHLSLTDKIFATGGTLCSMGFSGIDVAISMRLLSKYEMLNDQMLNRIMERPEKISMLSHNVKSLYETGKFTKEQLTRLMNRTENILQDRNTLFSQAPSNKMPPNASPNLKWRHSW